MIKTVSLFISILTMILVVSCGPEEPESSVSVKDQQALLANVGERIILPSYQNLDAKATALSADLATFKAGLNVENLIAIKASLKEVRIAWQSCNFLDFGPASEIGLSSTINTFPIDRDAIERNIVENNFNLESLAAADERGFAAIGYLLHGNGDSETEIIQQFVDNQSRIQYLELLIIQIAEKVSSVYQKWDADQGNYIETFKTATGIDVGSSLSLLTNAMTQSLERKTRDGKIGIPVGLRTLGVPVPNAVEALYGGYSTDLSQRNLLAYQNLFTGVGTDADSPSSGDGYFSYLNLLGETTLVTEITNSFAKSISATNALQEPYQQEVVDNPTPSNTAIANIQQLIVLIKTDMASAFGISITFQDNDGD